MKAALGLLVGLCLVLGACREDDVDVPSSRPTTVASAEPMNPLAGSVNPLAQPTNPSAQPPNPLASASNPLAQPANPLAQPARPVGNPLGQPASPLAQPAQPAGNPLAQPTNPLNPPASPLAQPAQSAGNPLAQPTLPLNPPANPLAQPAQPAGNPLAQPTNPLGQAANPLAQSANPLAQPARSDGNPLAQPTLPLNPPANPLAQPARPAGNPLAQPANPLARPSNPLAQPANPLIRGTQPPPPQVAKGGKRPECPRDWTQFDNPMIGMKAYVPPGWWVRFKGNAMLSVEKHDVPGVAAFFIPFVAKKGTTAKALADQFAGFARKCDGQFAARVTKAEGNDLAVSEFTTSYFSMKIEGRYCTMVTAGGSMAFVIGIAAPQGKFREHEQTLRTIAEAFAFTPQRARWEVYASPAGGFTMEIPKGWMVESNDGRVAKSNLDVVAFDPRNPLARAFHISPRWCSPQLLQHPMYQFGGYEAGAFNRPEDVAAAAIQKIVPNAKIVKMTPNAVLTEWARSAIKQMAQFMAGMNAGQMDMAVYDCVAEANVNGNDTAIVFLISIRTMLLQGGVMGVSQDLEVHARGWMAPRKEFINATPVLDRVQGSYALTHAFLKRVLNGNEHAAKVMADVNAHARQVDEQIRQKHWDTIDAIAEMNYDVLTDNGGYVNEKTGRIEKFSPDQEIRNSSGERVSREEVLDQRIPPDQATVIRGAHAEDYMAGAYGRIQF